MTDKTNKTLGFGIFYAMVNVGGSFRADRGRQAAGDLVGLRLHGGRRGDRADAADHDLLLQGAAAGDRGRRPSAQKFGEIGDGAVRPQVRALPGAPRPRSSGSPSGRFFNLCALYVDRTSTPRASTKRFAAVLGSGVAELPLARGRRRHAADPRRDDLAHRLHHHDPAGVRLAHGREVPGHADLPDRSRW